jgi:urease accessory protein
MSTRLKLFTATLALALLPAMAQAHPGHIGDAALLSGFMHPVSGIDHLLVMLAMGAWSSQLPGRMRFALPVLFLATLAIGALQPVLPVSAIEQGIAASVLMLGLLLATSARLPFAASCVLAAVFALLHGMAHGLEAPGVTMPVSYLLGFMGTSALLQMIGAGAAMILARHGKQIALRLAGFAMALCGLALFA